MHSDSHPDSDGACHRFTVGRFECVAINDGTFFYTAEQYFSDAPPDVLARSLAANGLDGERIPSCFTCLVVDTGEHVVVVDTGGDRAALQTILPSGSEPDVGRFPVGLARAGIEPGAVDHLIITHAHPDHIGANTSAAGAPRFPNARLVMWRQEWEFWTSDATLASQPPVFADPVRTHLLALTDRVELV